MAGDELDDGLEYDVNFSDSEAVTIENGLRVVSQLDENPSGGEVSVDEESHKENPRKRTKNPKLQEKKKSKWTWMFSEESSCLPNPPRMLSQTT